MYRTGNPWDNDVSMVDLSTWTVGISSIKGYESVNDVVKEIHRIVSVDDLQCRGREFEFRKYNVYGVSPRRGIHVYLTKKEFEMVSRCATKRGFLYSGRKSLLRFDKEIGKGVVGFLEGAFLHVY